jgi:DNA-binding transcriptional regulator YiaG
MNKEPISVKERLNKHVKIDPDTGCWVWIGAKGSGGGYGLIKVGPKLMLAHRASYMEYVGDIPEGMLILHRCDNPPCINPEHLFAGTWADNMRDMVAKGRDKHGDTRGEKNGQHKLNLAEIEQIRDLLEWGMKQHVIAQAFGVSRSNIAMIKSGRIWPKVIKH